MTNTAYDVFFTFATGLRAGTPLATINGHGFGLLDRARQWVEESINIRNGWTAEWSEHYVDGGQGVKQPHTHYLYVVKNRNGKTVQVANVTPRNR